MRTGKVNFDNLLFYLVLLVVALNMVLPGETWFQVRALSQLLAFAGFGAWLARRSLTNEACGRRPARSAGLVFLFLLFFLPSMLFSSCIGRSLEALTLWLAYFLLFLLVRGLEPDSRRVEQAISVVCLVAFALVVYGLYQYFTDFGGLAGAVAADTTLSEGQRADMLSRLASRRIFSTFPLPTTFAALLVLLLPLLIHQFRCSWRRRHHPSVVFWGTVLGLTAAVLPLTGSFGTLPVLAVLGGIALLARMSRWSPGRRTAVGGAALICVILAFFAVLHVRGFAPWDQNQAHNPVSQRLYNWRSAVSIWHEHPLAGAGPGNFAVAYAQHRFSGANETVVAHNTWLHAAAEGGIVPGAALALLGLLLGWRVIRKLLAGPTGSDGSGQALCYSVLALLLYACFEITVEFPGIGYPGIFFAALVSRRLFPLASNPADPLPGAPRGRERDDLKIVGVVGLALVLAAGFVWTCCWYGGQGQWARAVSLSAQGPSARDGAHQAAEAASSWNPLDPEPHAVRGSLLLAAGMEQRDPEIIRQAGTAFATAVALDPERAFFHDRLSVVHEGTGEGLAAFIESDKAWRLYPLSTRYLDRRKSLLLRAGGGP